MDYILPSVRAQLAKELVDCDISQRKVADILGLTPAAVSQYMSGKRGYAVEFDQDILDELRIYAGKICRGEIQYIGPVLCHVCNKVWNRRTLEQVEENFDTKVEMCHTCERLCNKK